MLKPSWTLSSTVLNPRRLYKIGMLFETKCTYDGLIAGEARAANVASVVEECWKQSTARVDLSLNWSTFRKGIRVRARC